MSEMSPAPTRARTLVVEDDPDFIASLTILLAQDERLSHDLIFATTLAEAMLALEQRDVDLIILDMSLPDSTGQDTLRRMLEVADDIPVVVLTSTAEWNFRPRAIVLGAEDYVVKERLEATVINTAVRHAVERRWLRDQLLQTQSRRELHNELAGLAELVGSNPTPVTAALMGGQALHQALPDRFVTLRQTFEVILEMAIDKRTHQSDADSDADVGGNLRELATVLGRLHVGPRDVVHLHTEMLKACLARQPETDAGLWVAEARLLVLELMGDLAAYYRSRALRIDTRSEALR